MFGTDLPSTRALRPYRNSDYSLVTNTFNQEDAENILYKNAIEFYKIKYLRIMS